MANVTCDAKICEPGGKGYLFPFPHENEWPKEPRVFLYLALLFWCFMGVAIVADIFMAAIEKVTSKKKTVINKDDSVRTYKVWNDTVANLTLMALGSSAPEILLNVIEICLGGFELGPLGASTIVGSAAFNLLIISAVCVIAIDGGDIRYIKDLNVYSITAFFSVFAYVWLLIIVKFITPEQVDVWEAVVTLLFFPLLTVLAYMADIGKLDSVFGKREERKELSTMDKEEVAQAKMKIRDRMGTVNDEKVAEIMGREYGEKVSRAAYRVKNTVGAKMMKGDAPKSSQVVPYDDASEKKEKGKVATLQFESDEYTVVESEGKILATVVRSGELETGTVKVSYKTVDGTAHAGKDFKAQEGELEFAKGVDTQVISIPIVDDISLEPDEYFTIHLFDAKGDDGSKVKAELGEFAITEIRIIDDDDPGQLCFKKSLIKVEEGTDEKTIQIHVERLNGCRGEIGCSYKTEDDSAKAGADYEEAEGTITIGDNQTKAVIEVKIKPRGRYESEEKFRVLLDEPTGGCSLAEDTERDMTTCTVIIQPDGKVKDSVDRILSLAQVNWDKNSIGNKNWKQQFIDALSVSGGDDEEEDAGPPGAMDYVMHALSVFWKVLFACIPPPDYCDGWLCFNIALLMIGAVTCIISDLANLVGCCLGLPGEITAITIVALGTSLPDTFASKSAAEQDPYADASVGNVTGSNSVNVFLGLGLPWTIASIYWAAKGGTFVVPSGNLGIGVATFCGCATCAIAILAVRRKLCGGELGGPSGLKWGSFTILLLLWAVYIAVSSIVVLGNKGACD